MQDTMPEKELNLFIVRRTSKMVVESSEYTCKVNIQTECQVRPLLGSTLVHKNHERSFCI